MSQVERLAYLDRRLRERGWVTAPEAAAHFEVSPRQIKRDIEYLRWRLEAPIVYDPVRRHYRYEKPYGRFRFADERRALFAALVRGWAASEALGPLVTPEVLASLEANLSPEYRVVVRSLRFDAPSVEALDLDVFAALCRALREGHCLELSYRSLAGQSSTRRVEAQRLWNYGGVWYLIAWDQDRADLRTFHLGRITGLRIGAGTVTHDLADPTWAARVEAWLAAGSGVFRGGETFRAIVRLRGLALRLAAPQRWHRDQTDRPGADAEGPFCDRDLPLVDPRELTGRLLALGAEAEPLAPAVLVDQWRAQVRALAVRVEKGPAAH